jgi:monoamine oxidase
MAPLHLTHILVVGAGAAGLMTARELVRAGKRVTILEARDRCGGRIYPLPAQEFGYPAEGGAEFVHGAAPVTRAMMREAQVSLFPRGGTRWSARTGKLLANEPSPPHMGRFYQALSEVKGDLPIAEFLETHFAGRRYDELRRSITRTSRATTRLTRAAPALSRFATNGWPGTRVSTGGSRKAKASSSSIFHPNAAGTEPRSISARP